MPRADWKGWTRSLLRIVAAFTFSAHGWEKWFGMFGGVGGHGAAPAGSLLWVAGMLETVGGILLFVGLFTRPVAFILSGEMAVGYFRQHLPHGFWPLVNGGEPAVLYCFLFLYLAAAGGGSLSLDRVLHRE